MFQFYPRMGEISPGFLRYIYRKGLRDQERTPEEEKEKKSTMQVPNIRTTAVKITLLGLSATKSVSTSTYYRQQIISRLETIKSTLAQKAETNGFYQFALQKNNFDSLIEKANQISTVASLHKIAERAVTLNIQQPARAAFVLNNYINFYNQVENGTLQLIDIPSAGETIENIACIKGSSHLLALFKGEGNLVRTLKKPEEIHAGKINWQVPKTDFAEEEWQQAFLNRLIWDQEQSGFLYPNSLFIRCSRKLVVKLGERTLGKKVELARLWLSLTHCYAQGFVNKGKRIADPSTINRLFELGWISSAEDVRCVPVPKHSDWIAAEEPLKDRWLNDPSNSVLVRIQLSKERYLALLESFWNAITERQVEGIHALSPLKKKDFIAKIEKNSPTIGLQDFNKVIGADFRFFIIKNFLE